MKILIFFLCFLPFVINAQLSESDKSRIRGVMDYQEQAWNEGDLDKFMDGYWNSEALRFTSSGRTSMGWQKTLDGYKKAYPTQDKMGKLTFEIFDLYEVVEGAAGLTGSFHLARSAGDLSGFFTLIWKKVDGEWKIISDMTCSD